MYTDYCLRFKDEAEADSVLFEVSQEPVYGPSETEFDESAEYTYTFKVNGDSYEFTSTEEIAKDQLLDTCRRVFYGVPNPGESEDVFTYMRLASVNKIKTPKQVQTGTRKVKRPLFSAVDEIGTIYKATGNMLTTPEGEVPEMAPLPGWHANVRNVGDAPELAQYQVFPNTPERAWA